MIKDDYLIFDFDGTIADSLPSLLAILNKVADKYGFRKITREDADELRNKGMRFTLKKLSIPLYKLPFLVRRARDEFSKEIDHLQPIEGMIPVLRALKKKGQRMGIVTSNSEINVRKFLKKNTIDIFDFVYGSSSVFGKERVIKKLLKEKKLRPNEVVYIGDETRDIEASKKCKIRIISVAWGANSAQLLSKNNPDWLIKNPGELLALMNT